MSSRQEFPWLRILGESVAIVVSILLAFAINAWWQEYLEDRREQEILVALLDDFEESKANISEGRAFHLAVQKSNVELLKAVTSGKMSLSDEEIERLVVDLTWWDAESHFSTGALSSLLSSGELPLIEDDELRRLLADWPSQIQRIARIQGQDYDFFLSVWAPFLRANSYLPQQAMIVAQMPGLTDAPSFVLDLELEGTRGYADMVANEEFHNILTRKSWIQFDILDAFDDADVILDQTIQRIESRM